MKAGTLLDASVIIPYRTPDVRLTWCLAGLAEAVAAYQVEVLLICNGGEDPESLGERWLRNAGLTGRALTVENPGIPYALSTARNLGFQESNSELVLCLDSDCVPDHAWLSGFIQESTKMVNPLFLIAGERRFIATPSAREPAFTVAEQLSSAKRVPSQANRGQAMDVRFPRMQAIERNEYPWDLMHGGNLATTKTAWAAAGEFDVRFDGNWGYEDAEFAYRVFQLEGSKAAFSPLSYVFHLEEETLTQTRPHRNQNPNWTLACELVPNFREYKLEQYRKLEQK